MGDEVESGWEERGVEGLAQAGETEGGRTSPPGSAQPPSGHVGRIRQVHRASLLPERGPGRLPWEAMWLAAPTQPAARGPRPELWADVESGRQEPPLCPWEEASSSEADASLFLPRGTLGAGLTPARSSVAGPSGDVCREHIYVYKA